MKKLLTALLFISILFSAFAVLSFAANEVDADMHIEEASEQNEENFFELIYNEFLKNSDKLLAALAFLGSLLVAFAYKKGLLPVIKASLNALASTVSKLKEESEKASEEANSAILSASKKLDYAENMIDALSEKLERIEYQLGKTNDEKLRTENIYAIIKTQIDMLYEVFMSSSLPAYQKDAVGERIAEMKKSLATSSGTAGDGSHE